VGVLQLGSLFPEDQDLFRHAYHPDTPHRFAPPLFLEGIQSTGPKFPSRKRAGVVSPVERVSGRAGCVGNGGKVIPSSGSLLRDPQYAGWVSLPRLPQFPPVPESLFRVFGGPGLFTLMS
jgi:hypothetical protein